MKFPIECHTRKGTVVSITGYYTGYARPWVGFIETELEDLAEPNMIPLSWLEDGYYQSSENPKSLDIIDLPNQFIEVSEQT